MLEDTYFLYSYWTW